MKQIFDATCKPGLSGDLGLEIPTDSGREVIVGFFGHPQENLITLEEGKRYKLTIEEIGEAENNTEVNKAYLGNRTIDEDGWVLFEEWGSFYKIEDGILMCSPCNFDNTRDDVDGAVETCIESAEENFLEVINKYFNTTFTYEYFDGKDCLTKGQYATPEKSPVLKHDENFDEVALKAIQKKFPGAEVICQHFNNEFLIEFKDGKRGYCGTVNGDLGCNLFASQEDMKNDVHLDDVTIAFVDYGSKED